MLKKKVVKKPIKRKNPTNELDDLLDHEVGINYKYGGFIGILSTEKGMFTLKELNDGSTIFHFGYGDVKKIVSKSPKSHSWSVITLK